ncbi:hypothetical protein [Polaromonas sp. YR568]|uniref:hypothetical protein n=1 Tax=Polaromonas sp. YR568 TaxID=1855301 RepID=UPI003137B4C9
MNSPSDTCPPALPSGPHGEPEAAKPEMTSPETIASTGPGTHKRLWVLALGTATAWHLDPALVELADMIAMTACANNKSLARDSIAQMRAKANSLRAQIPPLSASALAKVVRRAEAACGAVLDKGARVHEVQTSWEHFLTCVRVRHEDGPRR